MNCLVDGVVSDRISVRDRGLAYGDGVFRTLRCQGGQVWSWTRHYAKLVADCAVLGLQAPTRDALEVDIAALAPVDSVVKIIVTRGMAARGYACDPSAPATRIVQTAPLPDYGDRLDQGVQLWPCRWTLSSQPALAGVKHLNRLDQVMARREWTDASIFDGLMRDSRGKWVEGVFSNLFVVRHGRIQTHPLDDCGVAGVGRALVLELARELAMPVDLVAPVDVDLAAADEVFLCNSVAGVVPAIGMAEHMWPTQVTGRRMRGAWLERSAEEGWTWVG
jgi:4-amino-4-deoxychorismate lyase